MLVSSLVATPVALAESPSSLGSTKHHLANGYRNLDPSYDYTLFGRAASLVRRAWQRIPSGVPLLPCWPTTAPSSAPTARTPR